MKLENYQFSESLKVKVSEEESIYYPNCQVGDIIYPLDTLRLNKHVDYKSSIVFYLADENISTDLLTKYKQDTDAEFLIAIQTGDKSKSLEYADCIIECEANEVDRVLDIFDTILAGGKGILFNTDIGHFISLLRARKAYFSSVVCDNYNQTDLVKKAIQTTLNKYDLSLPLTAVCAGFKIGCEDNTLNMSTEYIELFDSYQRDNGGYNLYNFEYMGEYFNKVAIDMLLVADKI